MNKAKQENTAIDPDLVNNLLGRKERVDAFLKRSLLKMAVFVNDVETSAEAGLFNQRIVAVSNKTKTRYLNLIIKEQQRVNAALVAAAPAYFKESASTFKEVRVIEDAARLTITVNYAVNSQLRTGAQLATRAHRLAAGIRDQIYSTPEHEDKTELLNRMKIYEDEKARFSSEPDRRYRLRTDRHKDIVAMYLPAGGERVERVRVGAGGLLVLRSARAPKGEAFVKILDRCNNRPSLYDRLTPVENNLDFKGLLYDEEEAELEREHAKRDKDLTEYKIRSKNEQLVN